MLKWLCLTALILNLLLVAFAGFRLMTVPPSYVEAVREGQNPYRQESAPPARSSGGDRPAPAAATPPPASGDSPAVGEGTTRAEQAPALNVEAFGVSREQGRLSEIERQQEAKDALSQEVFD